VKPCAKLQFQIQYLLTDLVRLPYNSYH